MHRYREEGWRGGGREEERYPYVCRNVCKRQRGADYLKTVNVKAEEELQYSLLLIIVVVLAIIGKKVSVSDEQEKTTTTTKKGVLAA